MKMKTLLTLCLVPTVVVMTASCARRTYRPVDQDIVVKETYIHKYGVAVQPDDWAERGQDGIVISTLVTGVTVTKNFSSGDLQGTVSYTFPHSQIIEKIETYDRGILVRDVVNYPSGVPMRDTQYTSPTQRITTLWYESGSPKGNEVYENELLVKGEYYNIQHQLEAKVENGEGTRVVRDVYGQLEGIDTISNGQMASRKTLYPKGTPKEIISFQNEMIDGERKTFHPEGEPNTIEKWSGGKQHGIATVFKNGERWSEVPYENGLREGIERRYADDGVTVVQEITWLNDQMTGPSKTYIDKTVNTAWYWKNTQVSRSVFETYSTPH